ncbi:hypothetical protein SAMN05192576_4055 [Nocardioides szechwanensis]|uniref:Uncharacterized protein n=1 Tax=Nocardioides szechwanensis TaxID=1005944 RepID=A0A1H0JTY4_9ACTN|nr:hypothetical protein [Nocardioides szechwanensis]SDO46942.1 hypothetical protein SAMN05192576_4055 [Nocardioides szechwanensis]
MRVVRSLLLALGATAVAVGVGVLVTDGEEPQAPATVDVPSVPLSEFDTTELVAQRTEFCDTVPDEAVTEALAGESIATAAYGNGDRAKVAGTVRDVAHEFSCAWRGADGTVARAWVFVPPVTPAAADSLIDEARKRAGCEPDAGAPAYGVPSLALVCEDGGTRLRSYRGLFGDAWLTCQLSTPTTVAATAQQDRASRWCVSIATAAADG